MEVAGRVALGAPRIPLADAIIAATALTHAGGAVATYDEHFLIKGVRAEWLRGIRTA
jgi:predicted nucleic acid-binding protein